MNIEKAKDKARKFELKEQYPKAIEVYASILDALEGTPEFDGELSLFNKLGDLHLKTGNTQAAVETYERAAELYEKAGFPNNAIALCNKILRNTPGRTQVYLKLAKLMIQRGFTAEAKQNLLEYAERMQKAGALEQAFKALKEFADLSPQNEDIRLLLAEQLQAAARTDEAREQLAKLYAEVEATGDARQSRATLDKMRAVDPEFDPEAAPKAQVASRQQKTSDLVFLDLDDSPSQAAEPATAVAVEPPPPPRKPASLDLEPTALVEEEEPVEDVEPEPEPVKEVEIERASAEYLAVSDEIEQVDGLSVTHAFDDSLESAETPTLDIETTSLDDAFGAATTVDDDADMMGGVRTVDLSGLDDADDADDADDTATIEIEEEVEEAEEAEAPAAAESGVEVPELDLSGFGDEVDGRPSKQQAARASAGLPLMEVGEEPGAAGPADVATLEEQLADDPDDPALHRALGEALMEKGERERGLEELDLALTTAEARQDWEFAEAIAEEIVRLDPNSVKHHQKRVEYAYRNKDKTRLIRAYLGLADALFRSGAVERARAVYQRVIEHDPKNQAAQSALTTLEPVEEPPPPKPATPLRSAQQPAPAAPAPAPVPAQGSSEFVDLGSLVLDDDTVEKPKKQKDTRMRIEEEEPTGDEERDFAEMLAAFKKGIEENIEDSDWQSHYDLGVAFKEMGLLDEAIGAFQKALRSAEGRLKSAEALGMCFFEKGQFSVAVTVMKRAVDSDQRGDDEKIGLLYWLARSEEEQGKEPQALEHYQRVFAVDIGFQDVRTRVKALAGR